MKPRLSLYLSTALLALLLGAQACGVKAPPIPRNSITPQDSDDLEDSDEQKKKSQPSS